MLTVTKRAEDIRRCVAWYCDCDCGTTNFIALGSDLKKKRVKSCGCKSTKDIDEEAIREKLKAKEDAKRLSEQEKIDWDELYQYVRTNIMGYDKEQSLSKAMVLRLKGLLTNKFMENNNIISTANYSYKTILNTFKYCSPTIQNALRTNRFADEMHRFNFCLKIVERNINDVYIRMKNAEKAKEEAKNTTINAPTHEAAEYKPREKKKDRFSDLW